VGQDLDWRARWCLFFQNQWFVRKSLLLPNSGNHVRAHIHTYITRRPKESKASDLDGDWRTHTLSRTHTHTPRWRVRSLCLMPFLYARDIYTYIIFMYIKISRILEKPAVLNELVADESTIAQWSQPRVDIGIKDLHHMYRKRVKRYGSLDPRTLT